jgi:multidrug efflux pump subunit AcrA (membrane-fusion protein)
MFGPEQRGTTILAVIIIIIVIVIGGHLYGRYLASIELADREAQLEQLRAQSQKQQRDIDSKSQQLTTLQDKLAKTQATLDAIMPSASTYNINPNQTLILGDGHLTVGLVGPPANDSVLLNINGKAQSVAAGQTLSIAPDPRTKCQISVQSFDVFRAVVVATCMATKAQ